MMNRLVSAVSIAAALALSSISSVVAQDYPTRPIRVITNVSAGGTADVFIRALGQVLHERLGQPLIVEPRPGGNFTIGARACAESAPDGYTICLLSGNALSYNEFVLKQMPYDPHKDFALISNMFFNTQALVAEARLNVKNLQQLAALAKSKPKTLSYFAPAIPLYLYMEHFNKEYGTDLIRVPFRGGGQATAAILSGTTPVAFFGLANFISHIKAGKMVGLALDSAKRSPLFPDIPTLAELGYRGDLTQVYFGLVAPAGMPKAMIARLQTEIAKIMNEPKFRERNLIARGLEPIADTPEQFAQFLAKDRAAAKRIVKEAGLQPK